MKHDEQLGAALACHEMQHLAEKLEIQMVNLVSSKSVDGKAKLSAIRHLMKTQISLLVEIEKLKQLATPTK